MNEKFAPQKIKTFQLKRKKRYPYTDIVKIKTENNGFGLIKALVIFGIIGLQLLLFILLHTKHVLSYKWTAFATFIFSLITCIYVLSSNKNSHSKAVWIIFLLLFFPFAYLFYIISDERVIMLFSKKRYKHIFEKSKTFEAKTDLKIDNKKVKNDCEYLYNAGGFNTYAHTRCNYFSSGNAFFDDLLERLKDAKEFIFMEFFILSDGVLLNRTLDILQEKVKQGVKVKIIFDDMGSHKTLSHKTKKRILNMGIALCPFNKIFPFFSVGLNYRDHRKIVVIDGKTAYTGGCNLADEYVNQKRIHGYWKDCGVRLDGPAVDAFTLMFLRQWEVLGKKKEDYSVFLNKAEKFESRFAVVPYADGLEYKLSIGKSTYENMIAGADEFIYIMTPYFIVDDAMKRLLVAKAMSGVDVRIIIPEVPDKAFVYGVTRNNLEKLVEYGVKVYCMKCSFVHSKVLLTENSAVVGSINMDLRSFYQQFECAVYLNDKLVMDQIKHDFITTFEDSILITEKNKFRKRFIYRAFAGVMQIFAPFM